MSLRASSAESAIPKSTRYADSRSGGDDDILGLDISVNDVELVRVIQGRRNLVKPHASCFYLGCPVSVDDFPEGLSFDVLKYDVELTGEKSTS